MVVSSARSLGFTVGIIELALRLRHQGHLMGTEMVWLAIPSEISLPWLYSPLLAYSIEAKDPIGELGQGFRVPAQYRGVRFKQITLLVMCAGKALLV